MEHICDVEEKEVLRIRESLLDEDEEMELAQFFKMYADVTRLKILRVLFRQEMCVCEIAAVLDMTHSAISHQLATLRNARIIKVRRDGKNMYYSLDDDHIQMIFNNGLTHIREEK